MLYIVQAMPVVVRFPEPKHCRKKNAFLTEFTYQLAQYTDDIGICPLLMRFFETLEKQTCKQKTKEILL